MKKAKMWNSVMEVRVGGSIFLKLAGFLVAGRRGTGAGRTRFESCESGFSSLAAGRISSRQQLRESS